MRRSCAVVILAEYLRLYFYKEACTNKLLIKLIVKQGKANVVVFIAIVRLLDVCVSPACKAL